MTKNLLNSKNLERSSVIANSTMNRQRNCLGGNSYHKELAFNPIEFIKSRFQLHKQIVWLDLCCGTGKALIEAAEILSRELKTVDLQIKGIDLAGLFDSVSSGLEILELRETSVTDFQPAHSYDLITCVHGLHYIGDKLGLIQKCVSWLKDNGVFIANFDHNNLKQQDGKNIGSKVIKELKGFGLSYNSRKHLISCEGRKQIVSQYDYIGADDKAGPNYTGQPVVDSYYRVVGDSRQTTV